MVFPADVRNLAITTGIAGMNEVKTIVDASDEKRNRLSQALSTGSFQIVCGKRFLQQRSFIPSVFLIVNL